MMWDYGAGIFWMFFILLFWVGLAVLVIWVVRQFTRGPGGRALEILEERFARGEIDQEEFEARRRELRRR